MHVHKMYVGEGRLDVRWRGAALTQFDGRRWFNLKEPGEDIRVQQDHSVTLTQEHRVRPGERLSYTVQLSEIAPDTLFFAGIPQWISINVPGIYVTPTVDQCAGSACRRERVAI